MSIDSNMVVHLWAHQSEPSGRAGSLYFHGKDIYSYGRHFRCASVEANRQGERAYLVTSRTYSHTTAKHMCKVRDAIPFGQQVFHTPRAVSLRDGRMSRSIYREAAYYIVDQLAIIGERIAAQQKSRSQDYREQVEDSLLAIGRWIVFWGLDKRQKSANGSWLMPVLKKLSSPRKKDIAEYWHVSAENSEYDWSGYDVDKSQYRELLADILSRHLIQPTAIGGFEGRVSQLFIDRSGDPQLWEHFERRKEKQEEVNRRAEERREQLRAEQRKRWAQEQEERQRLALMTFEEKRELWHSGQIATKWFSVPSRFDFNALLRVRGDRIETSKGVCVEAGEAARLWKLIERFHRNEADFHHDLVHDANANQWAINSYSDDIMTVGCHRISYQEMHTVARQLKLSA